MLNDGKEDRIGLSLRTRFFIFEVEVQINIYHKFEIILRIYFAPFFLPLYLQIINSRILDRRKYILRIEQSRQRRHNNKVSPLNVFENFPMLESGETKEQ